MQLLQSIEGRHRAAGWRAGLAALAALAALETGGLGTACRAADTMGGLGSSFRPPAGATAPADGGSGEPADPSQGGLRVVVSGASRSVASIDGRIVHVGDLVNNLRVTRISPQEVVLTGEDGATERLLVSPAVVKRKPPAAATRNSNGVRQ